MIRISAAESQGMEAGGRDGPLTSAAPIRSVGAEKAGGEATVKTLINRLLKKKAMSSERVNGRALYRPILTREEYVTGESQGLLDRLFGGELAPLVAHYARHRALSAKEMSRLKKLIAELDGDDD